MKNFLLLTVFIFCQLAGAQDGPGTKSGIFPGKEIQRAAFAPSIYDSLVIYYFSSETDSVPYSKIANHYNGIPELTESFNSIWDSASNAWKYFRKYEYAYDPEGRKTLDSYYDWHPEKNVWQGSNKKVYAYDPAGNIVLYEYYAGFDTATDTWVGHHKYEAVFNDRGQLLNQHNYSWNTFVINSAYTSYFVLTSLYEYHYNAKGAIDSMVAYDWNFADSTLFKGELKSYLYAESDSLAEITDIYYLPDGTPMHNYRQDFTYDTTSVSCITSYWDNNAGEWYFHHKTDKVRNALGKEILTTVWSYVAGPDSLQPVSKNEYVYDVNGNLVSATGWEFDAESDSWQGLTATFYQYDNEKRKTGQLDKVWNSYTGDWIDDYLYEISWDMNGDVGTYSYFNYEYGYGDKIENVYNEDGIVVYFNEYNGGPETWTFFGRGYYYRTPPVVSGTGDPRKPDEITLYPNPVIRTLQIDGLNGSALLFIYDSRGQLVYTRKVGNKDEIDLGHLPAGLYLTRINCSSGTVKGKFVKTL